MREQLIIAGLIIGICTGICTGAQEKKKDEPAEQQKVVDQKKAEAKDDDWKTEKILKKMAQAKEYLEGEMAKFEKISPGWTLTNCYKEMEAGVHDSVAGKKNVLVTHPYPGSYGCVLSREMDIPEGKKTTLNFEVGHFVPGIHPRHPATGDWRLLVLVNKKELLRQVVGVKDTEKGWMTVDVDLSEYAGKKVNIELVHQMNEKWWFIAGYWAGISFKHE
jgi:hypothetical protein